MRRTPLRTPEGLGYMRPLRSRWYRPRMTAADLPADFFSRHVADVDPEIAELLESELRRQETTLEMTASENFVPQAILQGQGPVLTNKNAEGYPGRRHYGGSGAASGVGAAATTHRPRATSNRL